MAILACNPTPEPPPTPPAEITVRWAPVDGATHYRVQFWSGYTLLLEQRSSEAHLVLREHRARTVAAYDSVRVDVVAEDGVGGRVWEGQWPLTQ